MAKLAEADIRQALTKLKGWEQRENAIARTFEFSSFPAAITFVNHVAQAAEQANHHPDITINYDKVTLSLTSHDSGGVTERDLKLAARICELSERQAA